MISVYLLAIALMGETLLLMVLYLFHLQRRNAALQEMNEELNAQLEIQAEEPMRYEDYLRFIEYEFQRSHCQISELSYEDGSREDRVLIKRRIQYLNAEKESIIASEFGNNRTSFWNTWLDTMRDQHLDSTGEQHDSDQDAIALKQIKVLNNKIAAYEQRIRNMEHFKHLFLDLKEKFNDVQEIHNGIIVEVDKHLPEADRSVELKNLLSRMNQEKELIQNKLATIRMEFGNIFENLGVSPVTLENGKNAVSQDLSSGIYSSIDIIENNLGRFELLVAQQKQRIKELDLEVNSLKYSVSESDKIRHMVSKLSEKNEELNRLVATLEKENYCLSDQVQLHMKTELEYSEKLKEKLAEFSKKLIQKDIAYSQLESDYSMIEKQYLDLYEKHEGSRQAV